MLVLLIAFIVLNIIKKSKILINTKSIIELKLNLYLLIKI